MGRLDGKVAIITGANSGVGAEMAMLFAQEGASVVISARRVEPLEEVAAKIRADGGTVLSVPTDISKVCDVENLIEKTVTTYGKLDILVNNAGVLDKNLNGIANFDTEDLDRVIDINTKGAMYCIKGALSVMAEGSSIINIDSVAGVFGTGGAAYVASKAAMVGVTKHTAMMYAKAKIRCNAICPGSIITPMTMTIDRASMDMSVMGGLNAHGDMTLQPCMAIDVARVALFLATDDSKPITGQIITCDYGVTL